MSERGKKIMNWNYSYRAFLITSLLCGILILILYSIRLRDFANENEDLMYDVEIIPSPIIEEEMPEEDILNHQDKIETNRTFNQAEKEQSDLTRQSKQDLKEIGKKLAELDAALENTSINNDEFNKKVAISASEKELKPITNSDIAAEEKGGNKNTSVFYNLPGREAIYLPNPVYTCAASGKVSVNIEVTASGKVSRVSYNKVASTSTNQCLIDAAKQYSYQSVFSSDSSRKTQTGTITFVFPGQN